MPSVRSSISTSRFVLLVGVGALALLLLLELAFRLLPVSSSTRAGYHIAPRILTYPPGHRFTIATGWDLRNAHTYAANNYGFVALHDFQRDPRAIALIGDSFVEANMLDYEDRVDAHLEQATGRPVYAMGGPGSSLLDYAERARFAAENFGTRDFVIIAERFDVRQTLCGSGNVDGPCLDPKTLEPQTELTPPPGLAKRVLRESALAQYLFSQLRFNPAQLVARLRGELHKAPSAPRQRPAPDAAAAAARTDAIIDAFLTALPREPGVRFVLAVDADRQALAQGRMPDEPERTRLIERCRAAGLTVVDLASVFARHYESSPLALEIGPYDGHWNPLATRLVADAVTQSGGLR